MHSHVTDDCQEECNHCAASANVNLNSPPCSRAGKGTVKEVMALVMRKCVESTNAGDFARVEHELQVRSRVKLRVKSSENGY